MEFTLWSGLSLAFAIYGLSELFKALGQAAKSISQAKQNQIKHSEFDQNLLNSLSIVIPARDEEDNLKLLLPSLTTHSKTSQISEIIVVDDQSTDKTSEIATQFNCRVLKGQSLEAGWRGKNWACYQGAKLCTKEFILFTDADTLHSLKQISTALRMMKDQDLDLLSSLPFHKAPSLWEKAMGSFQILTLIASRAFASSHGKKPYAIGQFLLFKRSFYEKIEAHKSVRNESADDMAIAELSLKNQGRYEISKSPLYQVRMYSSFKEFWKGWVRIFRFGQKYSSPLDFLKVTSVFFALSGMGLWGSTPASLLLVTLSLFALFTLIKSYGEFSWIGILFFPIGFLMFIAVTLASLLHNLIKSPILWRNRLHSQ